MDKSTRNYPLEDIDRECLFHPNTSIVDHLKKGPHDLLRRSRRAHRGPEGRDIIDCGAGLWCVNIGYGRVEMAEAAKKAIENLAYHHIFGGASNEPIIRLAERVLQLFHDKAGAPHLSKVFFGIGRLGRQRHELQARPLLQQPARQARRRRRSSRALGAYHGLTYAAASLTGIPAYHKAFDLPVAGRVAHVVPALYPLRQAGRDRGRVRRSPALPRSRP